MEKQQIDLRGNAQRDGGSFAVTSELSEEQLSVVSGGKGGTKAVYLEVKMVDVIITSVQF